MKRLQPHDKREAVIRSILDHPLENEQDWRSVANLIDANAAAVAGLVLDPVGDHKVTIYFDSSDKVILTNGAADAVWQKFEAK